MGISKMAMTVMPCHPIDGIFTSFIEQNIIRSFSGLHFASWKNPPRRNEKCDQSRVDFACNFNPHERWQVAAYQLPLAFGARICARFEWTVVGLLVQNETRRGYLSLTNRICYSRANPTNSENQWNMPNRWLFSFSNMRERNTRTRRTSTCFKLRNARFTSPPVSSTVSVSSASNIFPSILLCSMVDDGQKPIAEPEREGEGARASPNQWICWFLCTHNGICFAIKWLPSNAISTEFLSSAFAFIVVSARRPYRLSLTRIQKELKVKRSENVFGSSPFSRSHSLTLSSCSAHSKILIGRRQTIALAHTQVRAKHTENKRRELCSSGEATVPVRTVTRDSQNLLCRWFSPPSSAR